MDHNDHLRLIQGAGIEPYGVWADMGSGQGAFTLALADLLGNQGVIYSIDRNASALKKQARRILSKFPNIEIYFQPVDFNDLLDLPPLDGIIMANALHYQEDQQACLRRAIRYLKPGGKFVIVEYNLYKGNPVIPYPVPYSKWQNLAETVGYVNTRLLATRPSRNWIEIYSALSTKAG